MKERIKELARQSGATDENGSRATTVYCFTEQELKGFAELVVRECFDVVINDGRFHDAKGIIRTGKYVAMEHFGVEE
jgi:hypothetical protein